MARGSLSSWRAAIEILLWRYGWAWPLTLLTSAAALALYFGLLVPTRTAGETARLELAQALSQRTSEKTLPPSPDQERLHALHATLDVPNDAAGLLRTVNSLAEEAQIPLTNGEYQQQRHDSTGVEQVHVTQTVRTSYSQMRRYIETVLRTLPNASLDQIAVRRESVEQSQLEVRLRWSIWIYVPAQSQANSVGPKNQI